MANEQNKIQMTLDEYKELPVMTPEEVGEFKGFVILPREDHDESSPNYKLMDLALIGEDGNAICRIRSHSDMFVIGGLPKIIKGKVQHKTLVIWYAHLLSRSGLLEMFCGTTLTCRGVGGLTGTCLSYEILPNEEIESKESE